MKETCGGTLDDVHASTSFRWLRQRANELTNFPEEFNGEIWEHRRGDASGRVVVAGQIGVSFHNPTPTRTSTICVAVHRRPIIDINARNLHEDVDNEPKGRQCPW
jgi:hypothetical protein